MKKILIIGMTDKIGGVETFIYNTVSNIDKNNFSFDFLIHGTDKCIYEKEIVNLYGNDHIIYFPSFKKHPLLTFIKLFKFYKMNCKKYDEIHLQTGSTAEIVYVFPFCKIYHIRVISHSHNGNGYSKILNFLFRPILNLSTDVRLSCSNEATKWLFGKNHLKDTLIINNGVDTTKFAFNNNYRYKIRKKYDISNNTLLVGHVGRFSEQKNHLFLIDIFEEMMKMRNDTKLMLVGSGENEEIVRDIIEKKGITDKVLFVGNQNCVEEYYSAFDIFLMPSLYEGLPIVGIEAQASGLYCFFSNHIDKQILITNKAYMIDLNDSDAFWAKSIINTYKISAYDRKKYSTIVEKNGYSLKETVKLLEKIYEGE